MFENFSKLLKKATNLKKEKKYLDALDVLKKAINQGKDEVTILHRLRVPGYLTLAGKIDEAWRETEKIRINVKNQKVPFEIMDVYNSFSSIKKAEGDFDSALIYGLVGLIEDANRLYKLYEYYLEEHKEQQKEFGKDYLIDWGYAKDEHSGMKYLEEFENRKKVDIKWLKIHINEKTLKKTSFKNREDKLIDSFKKISNKLPLKGDENLVEVFFELLK